MTARIVTKQMSALEPSRPWAYQAAFWGVALLLFLPPYFRGLFFATEQQRVLILAAVVFWLVCWWKHKNRDYTFLAQPLDYFILALPVIYVLAAFNAANYGLAVDEIVKNVLYFLVYWAVVQLVKDDAGISRLLHVVYIAAVGVALAGLATATGIIHIKDGFLSGRIYSSFQYPNALASYLAAAGFLGLFFWQKNGFLSLGATIRDRALLKVLPDWLLRLKPFGYLYIAANFLLLAVLFGTRSRGGLLVTGAVFILYLAGLAWPRRLPVLLHALLAGGLGYAAVHKFIPAAVAKQSGAAWGWIFAGLAAALLLQAVYHFLWARGFNFWAQNKRKSGGVLLGLAVAIMAGAGVMMAMRPALVQKIFSFEYLRNAFSRFYFIEDALAMLKARPLLGWGGGGWEEAYRSFQRYLYDSNEVHSYYFQVAVETGVPGLLAVAGIWAAFLWTGWRAYRAAAYAGDRRALITTLLAAAVAVGGHALIDFDLSLSALTLSLYTIFACVRAAGDLPEGGSTGERCPQGRAGGGRQASAGPGGVREEVPAGSGKKKKQQGQVAPGGGKKGSFKEKEAAAGGKAAAGRASKGKRRGDLPAPNRAWLAVLSVISVLIFSLGLTLTAAASYARAASEELQGKNVTQGLAYLEKAAAYNPFYADYHSNLMRVYLAMGQPEKAVAEAHEAAARSRYSAAKKADLATAYLAAGKSEKAVEYARQALAAAPFQIVWYEQLANTYAAAGRGELAAGNKEAARGYLEAALRVPELIQARVSALTERQRKLWKGPMLAPTPRIKLSLGQANYFLGKWPEAEKELQAAAKDKDRQLQGEAYFWLALVKEKQGKGKEAKDFLDQAAAVNKAYTGAFEQFKALPVM